MASSNFVNGNDVATFVLETDAPYNILDFDQGLCTMTGYSPRELSKKICTLDNLLYVEDFTEVIASMNYQLSISNMQRTRPSVPRPIWRFSQIPFRAA